MKNMFYNLFKRAFKQELRKDAERSLRDAYSGLFHREYAQMKSDQLGIEMDECVYSYNELSGFDDVLINNFMRNLNI